MKIAIDLDDVLANTTASLLNFINSSTNQLPISSASLENAPYWNFLGQTREEANENFFAFTNTDHFRNIEPFPEAVVAIEKLAKEHTLFIISGRPLFIKQDSEEWIKKYFPGKFSGVYFTNNRLNKEDFSAYWGRPKAEICDEIGAEVLIDDLAEYARSSEHIKVYLIDKPWNKDAKLDHAKRVGCWGEILIDLLTHSRVG